MADSILSSNNPFRRKSSAVPASTPAKTESAAILGPAVSNTYPGTTFPPPDPNLSFSATSEAAASVVTNPLHHHLFLATPASASGSASGSSSVSASASASTFASALTNSPHPTGDEFRQQLRALPKSSEAPPSTTFLKSKPVKKVRVQSPPPSSPDSVDADFEARFPAHGPSIAGGEAGVARARNYDDFSSESSDSDEDGPAMHSAPLSAPAAGKAMLDVDAFRKLLLTGQAPDGSSLPGKNSTPSPLSQPGAENRTEDTSSITSPANYPQETLRTFHETAEADDDRSGLIQAPTVASMAMAAPTASTASAASTPRNTLRKKPPPPSSRHGKLIKTSPAEQQQQQLKEPFVGEGVSLGLSSSYDGNKPSSLWLSPPEDTGGNVFPEVDVDRDTSGEAGSLPLSLSLSLPRPPTPPNASHSTAFSGSHPVSDTAAEALGFGPAAPAALPAAVSPVVSTPAKKPTPAPPPRRQAHTRSDSRSTLAAQLSPAQLPGVEPYAGHQQLQRDRSPAGSPRSSLESTRSRSSSNNNKPFNSQHGHAPAPPPPRRGNHHSARPTSSFVSPTMASFAAANAMPNMPNMPNMPSVSPSPSVTSELDRDQGVALPTTKTASPPAAKLLAKPPPPPARNPSVRSKGSSRYNYNALSMDGNIGGATGRPSSVSSTDGITPRRVTPQHQHGQLGQNGQLSPQQPPPPPPRQRGSSRGSMDGPASTVTLSPGMAAQPRRVSAGSASRIDARVPEQWQEQNGHNTVSNDAAAVAPASPTLARDILADLDALRREVDALRGQYGRPAGPSG